MRHSVSNPRSDLTADQVRLLLDYDPETGIFRWKHRADVDRETNSQWAGRVAGMLRPRGYRQICVGDGWYAASRLAWLLSYGEWPSGQVDHRNRLPSDNRIANLRIATPSQNRCNSGLNKNNKAGMKGVCWHKGNQRWRAKIHLNGKDYYLGYFDTPREAHTAYCKAASEMHGEFANAGTDIQIDLPKQKPVRRSLRGMAPVF